MAGTYKPLISGLIGIATIALLLAGCVQVSTDKGVSLRPAVLTAAEDEEPGVRRIHGRGFGIMAQPNFFSLGFFDIDLALVSDECSLIVFATEQAHVQWAEELANRGDICVVENNN